MDAVKPFDRICRFVGLQLAHQMQGNIWVCVQQFGPLVLRFLNPIFAKDELPLRNKGRNRLWWMRLGNRDQLYRRRLALSNNGGPRDTIANVLKGGD